jgi:hypothetical protein
MTTPKYTPLEQVAADYRVTPRRLKRAIREHGIAVLRLGRSISFDHVALEQLEQALRQCPGPAEFELNLASIKPPARPMASPSRARSRVNAYDAALKALTQNSPEKKRPRSKPSSFATHGTGNVVVLDHSAKRS